MLLALDHGVGQIQLYVLDISGLEGNALDGECGFEALAGNDDRTVEDAGQHHGAQAHGLVGGTDGEAAGRTVERQG